MENVSEKVSHFNNISLESDAFDSLDDVIKFIATNGIIIRLRLIKKALQRNDDQ